MGARHANKRTNDQRLRDRVEIASAYLRGESQASIAERLGLSRQQIGWDLDVIRGQWRASAIRDVGEHQAQELAKLDLLERTYWEAWQRSLEPLEHSMSEHVDDEVCMPAGRRHQRVKVPRSRTREATRIEQQAGDPACLAGIARCIEMRCRILGLHAPTAVNVQGGVTFGELFELAQQAERPRLEILAGSAPATPADHNGVPVGADTPEL